MTWTSRRYTQQGAASSHTFATAQPRELDGELFPLPSLLTTLDPPDSELIPWGPMPPRPQSMYLRATATVQDIHAEPEDASAPLDIDLTLRPCGPGYIARLTHPGAAEGTGWVVVAFRDGSTITLAVRATEDTDELTDETELRAAVRAIATLPLTDEPPRK